MKPKAVAKSKQRTTVAVSQEFGEKLTELAHGHGLSVADYCDKHLDAKVTGDWRNMLRRKLNDPSVKAGA